MRGLIVTIVILFVSGNSTKASKFSNEVSKFMVNDDPGTKWAILVAGSKGWDNYRHQADVCHAYQVLIERGLNPDNIIVFMYNDIANNPLNHEPGIIRNSYYGPNVYDGVIIDYEGDEVTAKNFYHVILGRYHDRKVVPVGPNDRIFIYYSGHGDHEHLYMPYGESISHDMLNLALLIKYSSGFKSMVIYLEACYSGSMFKSVNIGGMNIYSSTAATADEVSYGAYCAWGICLADGFSAAWLENTEQMSDLRTITFSQQYQLVSYRVAHNKYSSHVTQLGSKEVSNMPLSLFMGDIVIKPAASIFQTQKNDSCGRMLSQMDASLYPMRYKLETTPVGSAEHTEVKRKLDEILGRMKREDMNLAEIEKIVFQQHVPVPPPPRPSRLAVAVADADHSRCLSSLMRTYRKYCGGEDLSSAYGKPCGAHFRKMCSAGVTVDQLAAACTKVCASNSTTSSSSNTPPT